MDHSFIYIFLSQYKWKGSSRSGLDGTPLAGEERKQKNPSNSDMDGTLSFFFLFFSISLCLNWHQMIMIDSNYILPYFFIRHQNLFTFVQFKNN